MDTTVQYHQFTTIGEGSLCGYKVIPAQLDALRNAPTDVSRLQLLSGLYTTEAMTVLAALHDKGLL